MAQKNTYAHWILLGILSLIWGSSFILIKRGLLAFSPVQVGTLRLVIAGLCVLPIALRAFKTVTRDQWKYLLICAAIGNAIPAILYPTAQTHLNSATAGVLTSLTPLFTLVVGILLFHKPFERLKLLGVLVGLGGAVFLILSDKNEEGGFDLWQNLQYGLLCVLASIGYGTSTNIMKYYLSALKPIDLSALLLVFACIPYFLYFPFSGVLEVVAVHESAMLSLGAIFLLAALGTALALILFNKMLQLTSPVFASSVTYLMPIVALGFGLLDGEGISFLNLLATAIILSAVYMVNR